MGLLGDLKCARCKSRHKDKKKKVNSRSWPLKKVEFVLFCGTGIRGSWAICALWQAVLITLVLMLPAFCLLCLTYGFGVIRLGALHFEPWSDVNRTMVQTQSDHGSIAIVPWSDFCLTKVRAW